jgi:hypothetical protein
MKQTSHCYSSHRIPFVRPARTPVGNSPPQSPSCFCPGWICVPLILYWVTACLKSNGDMFSLYGGCYKTLQCVECNLLTSVCHMWTGVVQHVHARVISAVNGMFSKGSAVQSHWFRSSIRAVVKQWFQQQRRSSLQRGFIAQCQWDGCLSQRSVGTVLSSFRFIAHNP